MTVKDLFEKYCTKTEEGKYLCRCHRVTLRPASAEELQTFRDHCEEYGVEQQVEDELAEFYSQTNSLFNYFVCNDESIFEWWEDEEKSLWLGCMDDETFVYNAEHRKYAIGYAGSSDIGEYDSIIEMLEAYLKEGWENGWNG